MGSVTGTQLARVLVWATHRGMGVMDGGLGRGAAVEFREKAPGCVQCNSWPDDRSVSSLLLGVGRKLQEL